MLESAGHPALREFTGLSQHVLRKAIAYHGFPDRIRTLDNNAGVWEAEAVRAWMKERGVCNGKVLNTELVFKKIKEKNIVPSMISQPKSVLLPQGWKGASLIRRE